jgi:hypothetical protein
VNNKEENSKDFCLDFVKGNSASVHFKWHMEPQEEREGGWIEQIEITNQKTRGLHYFFLYSI